MFKMKKLLVLGVALAACLSGPVAEACSRATWLAKDGSVITGRSMDWPYDFNTHIYMIPQGATNEGIKGGLTWVSKYGVVVAAGAANPGGPINAVFDGVNEKGLGGNMLYLAETDFGPMPANGSKPRASWTAWLQYRLSNYATVAEAVDALKDDDRLRAGELRPGRRRASVGTPVPQQCQR